jgi:hypothetical protein
MPQPKPAQLKDCTALLRAEQAVREARAKINPLEHHLSHRSAPHQIDDLIQAGRTAQAIRHGAEGFGTPRTPYADRLVEAASLVAEGEKILRQLDLLKDYRARYKALSHRR